jgi:hypothetical protein
VQDTPLFTVTTPSSSTPEDLRVALPGRLIVNVAVRRPVELRLAVRVMVAPVVVTPLDRLVTVALRNVAFTVRVFPDRDATSLEGLVDRNEYSICLPLITASISPLIDPVGPGQLTTARKSASLRASISPRTITSAMNITSSLLVRGWKMIQ